MQCLQRYSLLCCLSQSCYQLSKRTTNVLVLAAIVCGSVYADTKTIQLEAGAAEIRISAPAGADVSWEARSPVNLRFITHTLDTSESAIVFCAANGVEYVIVSDVIDWDARKRTKTTWIGTVKNGDDNDGGNDDDNKPDPDPDPPPVNVPNKYGIGPAIYPSLTSKNKTDVAKFIEVLSTHEQLLNSLKITGRGALTNVEDQLDRLTGWEDTKRAFSESIQDAARQYGSGTNDVKNYFREARLTAELVR